MNNKLAIIAVCAALLLSCERIDYGHPHPYRDDTASLSNSSDKFHSDILYGNWQCQNGLYVGNREFLEIRFIKGGYADVIVEEPGNPVAYTVPAVWRVYGRAIDIAGEDFFQTFWVEDYLWPSLYVKCGSNKVYEIVKRRTDN